MEGRENNLARLREQRELTQKEVAEALDITRQAISQWESGRAFPSMEKQLALCRLYRVPLEELYGGPPAEEAPAEAALEPERENVPKRVRPSKTVIFFLALAALYLSIYIWGVVTNSRSIATINLFYLTAILIAAIFLYGMYRVIIYLTGKGKSEK